MSSDNWEEIRKNQINSGRAEKLQVALEEAGYFKRLLPPHPTVKEPLLLRRALVSLLIDFLHITDKEDQLMDSDLFHELVETAYNIFLKEPRFPKDKLSK